MTTETLSAFFQNRFVRLLFLDHLDNARQLLNRYNHVDDFRTYIEERGGRIIISLLVIFMVSIACVMAMITLVPRLHWVFILPLLVTVPLIFGGSLFVQVYMFFSWIEGRSMERILSLRHKSKRGPLASYLHNKLRIDMGPMPPVPWVLALLFVLTPLSLLCWTWLGAALTVIALIIATPLFYAAIDR